MYSVFLDGWQFPVTPSKLNVAIKGKNKTLTLVNDGEINFLKTPGLTEIESFDASFPMLAAYPFAVYPNGFRPPDYFLGKLESLMTNKKPAQFIISRVSPTGKLLFSTNMQVSVESYTIKESATDGLDVTVSIKLKQYKSFSTKTVTLPAKQETKTTNVVKAVANKIRKALTAPKAKTYTVKKGDSLWAIAKKYTGNGSKYTELYNANKSKIKNPNLIYVGQVLTLPW